MATSVVEKKTLQADGLLNTGQDFFRIRVGPHLLSARRVQQKCRLPINTRQATFVQYSSPIRGITALNRLEFPVVPRIAALKHYQMKQGVSSALPRE